MIIWFQNAFKIGGKTLQIRCFKRHVFGFEFWMDFLRFGLRKQRQNRVISAFLSKTQFLWKSLFSPRKNTIFLVRSLEKSTNIGCANAIKNDIEKNASKIEVGKPFGFPKSLKIFLHILFESLQNPSNILSKFDAKPFEFLSKSFQNPSQILTESFEKPLQYLATSSQVFPKTLDTPSKNLSASFQTLSKIPSGILQNCF